MKGYSKYFWFIHFIGDVFFINVAFLLMYYLKFDNIQFDDKYRFLIIIFFSCCIFVLNRKKIQAYFTVGYNSNISYPKERKCPILESKISKIISNDE